MQGTKASLTKAQEHLDTYKQLTALTGSTSTTGAYYSPGGGRWRYDTDSGTGGYHFLANNLDLTSATSSSTVAYDTTNVGDTGD